MSNVVDLLESLGRDARLRYAPSDELERVLANAEVAPALSAAILGNDMRTLENLLGAQSNVCCAVHPPDEQPDDEPAEDEDEDADEDDGEASTRAHRRSRH